ncbi:MAG: hypothetical protein LBC14_08105 [Desulfovibrio sp.]|nr:hypothetical protein [Desulfovibrio sp.]
MRTTATFITAVVLLLFAAGCGEQGKIDSVKNTVAGNCSGKTVQGLVSGLLQNPVWSFKKEQDGKEFVLVSGTLAGDTLPAWVKEQKMLDITFRFALDPKTDKFDPAFLDAFPSLTSPEGVLQAYKALVCK